MTDETANIIRKILAKNHGKFPRITLIKGGCAGSILSLILDKKNEEDIIVNAHNIDFLINKDLINVIGDITIYTQFAFGTNILIRNNLLPTCQCGKSFRIK